jgi:hypothetical protein
MRRKIFIGFLAVVLIAVLMNCASFVKTSYVTLNESKDLYTLAMTTVANLQTQGVISVDQRAKINQIAKIYKESHNMAVDALTVYKQTNSAADKDKVIVAIATAASKWQQVASLINAIKPGLVPATFSK